jgi:hypothetical protein
MIEHKTIIKCNSEDCIYRNEKGECQADYIDIDFEDEYSIKAKVECPYEQK